MKRTEAREQAFILIFEKQISGNSIEDIVADAEVCRDFSEDKDGYILKVFKGVYENLEAIDDLISSNLSGWIIDRISRVSLAVLRLAVFEIKYFDEIPVSVSIDEAVELCKKYSVLEDASFVNGVLGTIAKGL